MKRRARALLGLLISALLLSGCWQAEPEEDTSLLPPEEEPQSEGPSAMPLPQTFSLPFAPNQSLDPISCPDGAQRTAASLLCEGLFRLDGAFQAEYALCSSYTRDETCQVFVFTLREGAVFSDGSPVTAADVRASLDRARQSERYGARLAGIASVSAGEGSVTVRLSSPNVLLPALLDVPIVKSGTQEDLPIGSGPYALTGQRGSLSLTANPYWPEDLPVERIDLVEAAGVEPASKQGAPRLSTRLFCA